MRYQTRLLLPIACSNSTWEVIYKKNQVHYIQYEVKSSFLQITSHLSKWIDWKSRFVTINERHSNSRWIVISVPLNLLQCQFEKGGDRAHGHLYGYLFLSECAAAQSNVRTVSDFLIDLKNKLNSTVPMIVFILEICGKIQISARSNAKVKFIPFLIWSVLFHMNVIVKCIYYCFEVKL